MSARAIYSNRRGFAQRLAARGQRGIVLITALILLVIITLVALLAVQGSISGEQVSRNLRTNAVAVQAAETALRLCEDDLLRQAPTYIINPVPLLGTATFPVLWQTRANWDDPLITNTVTAVFFNSADPAARNIPVLPRCMIEEYRLRTDGDTARQSYVVTARGFSADYSVNALGQVVSGGSVWLQSILRR